jgi:hypothetical protein
VLVASVANVGMPPEALRGVDLQRVRELARVHRVSGFVADFLARAGVGGTATDDVRADASQVLVAHLRALADLAAARDVLDTLGVPWAVIKGPVLAEHVYAAPTLRGYTDVDVVVPLGELRPAIGALEAAGARVLEKDWSVAAREVAGELNLAMPFGTALDLHWDVLYHGEVRDWFRVPTEELLARRRRVVLGGDIDVPTFDASDTMLHLGLHAARSGAQRLIWLADIDNAIRRDPPDWDVVVDRARRWRIALPVGTALARAARVLSAPVPRPVARALVPLPWRAVTAFADRVAPPQHAEGASLASVVARSARGDLPSSLAALASGVARAAAHRRSSPGVPPSTAIDADLAGRESYLRSIEQRRDER